MNNKFQDLFGEIEDKRNGKESILLYQFFSDLLDNSGSKNGLKKLEKLYHCDIYESCEKHNQLQHTYYYEISSQLIKGELHLEVESGISNGTQLIDYSFHSTLLPESRTIEIIKDVILDEERVLANGFSVIKARAVFPRYKDRILELNKKQSYDDYVTGGGTNITNNHYKNEFDEIRRIGIFWKYIYEEIEVDVNLI